MRGRDVAGALASPIYWCQEMALIDDKLYFAPGVLMKDLELGDPGFLLWAFEQRVKGLFLAPIRVLQRSTAAPEGSLFGAALLVAALIESIARVETGSTAQGTLIKNWLEVHVTSFQETLTVRGGRPGGPEQKSAADVFEYRFRNGLAHNGYVASLGRLSGSIVGPVNVDGDVVVVNPFALATNVEHCFDRFLDDLREGRRDIKLFAYHLAEQFKEEVARAKTEAAG